MIPSPYGRQRPRTTAASRPARNSAASRDLPMPAAPRIVKSCARPSARLASASSSCRRSRVAADQRRPARSRERPPGACDEPERRRPRLDVDRAPRELERARAEQDLARRGRACEPRRVAAGGAGRRRLVRAGDDLAGGDSDPRTPAGAPRSSTAARRARSASSSWTAGTPKTRGHRVAGRRLDRAAVALDTAARRPEQPREGRRAAAPGRRPRRRRSRGR